MAPGGQDGLLGLALHPELLKGTGNDYVYTAYTYKDKSRGPDDHRVTDPYSPYRDLYTKIVRLTYDQATGTLERSGRADRRPAGEQRPQLRPHEDRAGRQALLHDRRRR